jgi:hypothetical protein
LTEYDLEHQSAIFRQYGSSSSTKGSIPPLVAKTVTAEPDPHPWAVANHLKERIAIVKQLSETKKLDAGLAKIAIAHFETHLKEINALTAQTK